ncbi:MAG: ABC transporter substrate-binding protein [Bacteroidetes bacterium]|nr:ABC transporter substrate-binding protein [Bacteroidota bacterium]
MKKKFVNNLSQEIIINSPPQRIISLVPSITELLFDLRLNTEIVGITKYCVHPKELIKNKTIVGGVQDIDFATINFLKPDLIIANKEENDKDEIIQLSKNHTVLISDIKQFDDALKLIKHIGELTKKIEIAQAINKKIIDKFYNNKIAKKNIKVAYLIWKNPYITINKKTFINDMLEMCGLENVFAEKKEPYPKISLNDIKQAKPDFVLLSSEPYSFNTDDAKKINENLPFLNIKFVDGEMFSWYGSHIIKSYDYFQTLFNEI